MSSLETASNVTVISEEHCAKHFGARTLTVFGIAINEREEHPEKADS
jgi:hypothetical protein